MTLSNNILYELLNAAEWPPRSIKYSGDQKNAVTLFSNGNIPNLKALLNSVPRFLSSFFPFLQKVNPHLACVKEISTEWKIAHCSGAGGLVAVLQDFSLEVRSARYNYTEVIGRCTPLYSDPHLRWRMVSWFENGSMLAVGYSNGVVQVFTTTAQLLYTIYPPRYSESVMFTDTNSALVGLFFTADNIRDSKWLCELMCVDYSGMVRSYLISPTEGYQISFCFSLSSIYPQGITAVALSNSMLVVGGSNIYCGDPNLSHYGQGHGISLWRRLDEYPFYKQVSDMEEDSYEPPSVSLVQSVLSNLRPKRLPLSTVFALRVSPCGKHLSALHLSGSVSVWHFPSLRKNKYWQLHDQPESEAVSAPHPGAVAAAKVLTKVSDTKTVCLHPGQPLEMQWWCVDHAGEMDEDDEEDNTPEDSLVLCRNSGALTISSVSTFSNLLGVNPEFLSGVPMVCVPHSGEFLCLELERRLSTFHRRRTTSSEPYHEGGMHGVDWESEETDHLVPESVEEETPTSLSYLSWFLVLFWNFLYWLTDDERFRVSFTGKIEEQYRLVLFKSSSPEELFRRKIANREYGDALLLAMSYGLNSDLVYQAQWKEAEVRLESISDFLSRVRCRPWVLHECCTVVPSTLLAARELLLYGLRGTGLQLLINLGTGDDNEDWITEASIYDCTDNNQVLQLLGEQKDLLKQINWGNLNDEQEIIVRVRQKLLTYLDRLETYEHLLGGRHLAPERYDPSFYSKFRDQSTIAATQEFAKSGNIDAVHTMWTYHGKETLPHRLAILSNMMPTLGPFEYRWLLPGCDEDGNVYEWEESTLRDIDWCEDSQYGGIYKIANPSSENLAALCMLYASIPSHDSQKELDDGSMLPDDFESSEALTAEQVGQWYRDRATYLESCCGMVDSAIDLLKFALERNVPGVDELLCSLRTLETLVYETGHCRMTLKQLQSMSPSEVVLLFMQSCQGAEYLQRMQEWLMPYLERCEAAKKNSRDPLLAEYLQREAKTSLQKPLTIIKTVCTSSSELLQGTALHKCAVACVYACEDTASLRSTAYALLDALPPTADSATKDLLQRVREHLWCCSVLQRHGASVLPSVLRHITRDQAIRLYGQVLQTVLDMDPYLSRGDWEDVLEDLLSVQRKVITCISPTDCYKVLAETLLMSGVRQCIENSAAFLTTTSRKGTTGAGKPHHHQQHEDDSDAGLEYRESVELVLKAAREYYNTAANYKDAALDLSRVCLELVQTAEDDDLHAEVQREKDLIAALEILQEFGLEELPIDVRVCSDRLHLVVRAVECSPSTALQYWWRALQLAQLLRVCDDNKKAREASVLTLLARQAIKMEEYEVSQSLCEKLIALAEPQGWEVCAELATVPQYSRLQSKALLLDYALTHCPPQQLPQLIQLRDSVELRLLYTQINRQMDRETSPLSDEEATDDTAQQAPSVPGGSVALLQDATQRATAVLQAVGSRRFWSAAVSWLKPLHELSACEHPATEEDNSEFMKQGCHAFYEDCFQDCHCSNIGYTYQSYSAPTLPTPALQFSMQLLRAAHLQACIEGERVTGARCDTQQRVLQELAVAVLPQDTLMGVSILLLLQEPRLAEEVFSQLPNTDISLQVCRYYYSIQIYCLLYPWPFANRAPVFLHDPSTVISYVAKLAAKYRELCEAQEKDVAGHRSIEFEGVRLFTGQKLQDSRLEEYYNYFNETESLLEDYVQGQALHRLDAGVDVDRFLTDSLYKEDTVLGLCMTTDQEVLDLAITLAKKYQVSLWDVHMTQLQYLFSSELSTEELQEYVTSRAVMRSLKTRADEFIATMSDKVLRIIDGTDHNRLSLYYSLIAQCDDQQNESSSSAATAHMAALQTLQTNAPQLNYHLLVGSETKDVLNQLGSAITPDNITALAELAETLPGCPVSKSQLYCAWCLKQFFASAKQPQSVDWVKRYRSMSDKLQELTAKDLLELVRSITLTEQAFKLVSLDARCSIIDLSLKFVNENNEGSVSSDAEDEQSVPEKLLQWKEHLTALKSSSFNQIISGPDLALRNYARLYGSSGGDSSTISVLCERVLIEGCDLNTLRELVGLMPSDAAPQPEDTLHGLILTAIEAITTPDYEAACKSVMQPAPADREVEVQRWSSCLQHLTDVAGQELKEGNDLLTEELLVDAAMEAARNDDVPLQYRTDIVSAFTQHMPEVATDDLNSLLLWLNTCTCIQAAKLSCSSSQPLPSEKDVSSSKDRAALFESLVSQASTIEQTTALVNLLHLWPAFDVEVYESLTSNPWEVLLTKLIGESGVLSDKLNEILVWDTVTYASERSQLPVASLGHLCLQLLAAGQHHWPLAAKIALLKHNPRAVDAVIENYNIAGDEVRFQDYNDDMLASFIKRGLVPKLIGGPLYEPCIDYLVRVEESAVVQGVIEQLQVTNPQQAAVLSQRVSIARPALTSLTTAFKKVYNRLL